MDNPNNEESAEEVIGKDSKKREWTDILKALSIVIVAFLIILFLADLTINMIFNF